MLPADQKIPADQSSGKEGIQEEIKLAFSSHLFSVDRDQLAIEGLDSIAIENFL